MKIIQLAVLALLMGCATTKRPAINTAPLDALMDSADQHSQGATLHSQKASDAVSSARSYSDRIDHKATIILENW